MRGPAGAPPRQARDVVVCSLEPWDEVWRRNQFLVDRLRRLEPDRRFLFVAPPVDVLHELRRRHRPAAAGEGPRALAPNLWHLRPRKVLPRALGPHADRSLERQLLHALAALGFQRPTLWVNDSTYAGLAARARWPVVYDITDDWLLAEAPPRERERRRRHDDLLLAAADAVVVCSPGLAESRRRVRPVEVIPNAVDTEHFRRPQPRPADLPAAPVAVYVGTLHEDRFDLDLCCRLAGARPDVQVALVGPCALDPANRRRLEAFSNIHVLGARPYASVPGYLQHADVIVVPHAVNPFTESLDPIKAYEVLAVGTAAVATPVAGFRDLDGPVEVADGDAFVAAVDRALAAPRRPLATSPAPSWEERAEQFAAVLRRIEGPERSRLRVAYIDHCAQPSGGELALLRLVRAQRRLDQHVVLGEDGPLRGDFEAAGAEVVVLPLRADVRELRRGQVTLDAGAFVAVARAAQHIEELRRRLRDIAPDVVHTNSLKAAVYGGVAGRLAGRPVVWHIRDRIAGDYLPRTAVRMVRLLAGVVPDAVIANSAATASTLGSWAARRRPPQVVRDPVEPVGTVRREGGGPLRIGIVGRIAPWKGQDLFLRAFAAAFPDGDERAVIIGAPLFGEHEFDRALHALVERLGIAARTDLRGFRADVPDELSRLDVLVHASTIPEPFGLVVVEGMAAGLPVIAPDQGGPSEVIEHDLDGVLYRMGDADELAAALVRVAADGALRTRLGAAARDRAAWFTPELVAEEVAAVYDRVLAAPRRGRRRPAATTPQPQPKRVATTPARQ